MENDFIKDYETIHEGRKKFPYQDSIKKKVTIGIGRNLTDVGLSDDEIDYLFENDRKKVLLDLVSIFPNWNDLSPNRQKVLFDMRFQLGVHGFLGFHEFIAAVKAEQWGQAAIEIVKSALYSEVPSREQENIHNITLG
jgi:lysozyme